MIRGLAAGGALLLMLLAFYLPAAYGPEPFTQQLLRDHHSLKWYWHPNAAACIMHRIRSWEHGRLADAFAAPHPAVSTANNAEVDRTVAQIHTRLIGSRYAQAWRSMLALGCYRWATLLQWLPLLLTIGLAMMIDGGIARKIRAHEFKAPNPEYLAVFAAGLILTLTALAGTALVPIDLAPWLIPGGALFTFLMLALMLAEFHHPHR